MNKIQSHHKPDLLLHEHIAQVYAAMRAIWAWHSHDLIHQEIKGYCRNLSRLHDLGKGSAAFQAYIENPTEYLEYNNQLKKSHAPLSLLLTLLKAKEQEWTLLDALLLGAIVYGHHGALPMLSGCDGASGGQKTMDRFAGGRMYKILLKQLQTTDYAALEKESRISLSDLSINKKSVQEAKRFLKRRITRALRTLALEDAVVFRLKVQLVFSILLEADKAFLAVADPAQYLKHKPRYWKSEWIDQKIGSPEETDVNKLRRKARQSVQEKIREAYQASVHSLTAPTGLGKTLLAADWALRLREISVAGGKPPPKVIVVLPYLSIIEQTAKEYRKLLEIGGESVNGSWLLTSHSLSSREYNVEYDDKSGSFFIDAWRTELVITTYDQFLMSLIDPRAKYQMRFHNLCDALVIMDEVQTLPCRLWRLLDGVFRGMADSCCSRILLMSATLPPFVPSAEPLLRNHEDYFKFRRYRFRFTIGDVQGIDDFCVDVGERLGAWLENGERVLITLNTRKSARQVFDYIDKAMPDQEDCDALYFISADVTPGDRLRKIEEIKQGAPCIVVSTQCIEAGVDIDMSIIIRDFAPWDSLVQIAGRCNREGKRGALLDVLIVDLGEELNGGMRRFSEMIYDEVHLAVTRQVIGSLETMPEDETLEASEIYFRKLNEAKDTGQIHSDRFAYWKADIPIRELLRGKEKEKYSFLVIEQDASLLEEMEGVNKMEDRWDRREAWRCLAGRIARISISVFARPDFKPEDIADYMHGQFILRSGFYDPRRGLAPDSVFYDTESGMAMF